MGVAIAGIHRIEGSIGEEFCRDLRRLFCRAFADEISDALEEVYKSLGSRVDNARPPQSFQLVCRRRQRPCRSLEAALQEGQELFLPFPTPISPTTSRA